MSAYNDRHMPPRPTWDRFRLIALPAEVRRSSFARDVAAGLTAPPKRLSCCYFYDAEGSRLFEDICELPEYYLTAAERAILQEHAGEIAELFVEPPTLVELGSGNAAKTRLIIEALLRQQLVSGSVSGSGSGTGTLLRYVPIDICRTVLEESSLDLLRDYTGLEILAVAGEYHEGLRYLHDEARRPKLVLWLGSNIGNFERAEAAEFLRKVRDTLSNRDRLLVGIDLRKDRGILEPAYDDAQGVTAEFNKNLLARINRELGGHFNLDQFQHRAVYSESEGRVEMYLISARDQEVAIDELKLVVPFTAREKVHTENSYKYSPVEIEALAQAAGLTLERQWFDPQRRFSLNLFDRMP
jgi:L-histidine N-alpha-methyltransferase